MSAVVKVDVCDAWKHPVGTSKPRLSPKRERRLLEELAECRRTLATALARDPKQVSSEKTDDPRMMSRFIAEAYRNYGPADSALGAVFQRYFELRAELALANMRLVAHVAKRYRQRGVAYSDLLQEGFCGLDDLELDEAVGKWMVSLRPRERQVLSYRFGLGGSPRLSLSQVGEVLNVSKERVRQIQGAALKVLRTNASRDKLIETSRKK